MSKTDKEKEVVVALAALQGAVFVDRYEDSCWEWLSSHPSLSSDRFCLSYDNKGCGYTAESERYYHSKYEAAVDYIKELGSATPNGDDNG